MKWYAAIVVGLCFFVLCSSPARADIEATPCTCTTEAQWVSKAQSMGAGTHYLYSFAARDIRKFRASGQVWRAGPGEHDTSSTSNGDVPPVVSAAPPAISWLVVEPRYQAYFSDLLAVRDHFGVPVSKITIRFDLPSTATNGRGAPVGSYNAYDILNTPSNNVNLTEYLRDRRQDVLGGANIQGMIAEKLFSLLQSLDKALTKGELLSVTITVVFPDGSEMEYKDSGEGKPGRVEKSGVDREANPVLDTIDAGSGGIYNLHQNDVDAWLLNMERLGVEIVNRSGGVTRYSCSFKPGTNELSCRRANT